MKNSKLVIAAGTLGGLIACNSADATLVGLVLALESSGGGRRLQAIRAGSFMCTRNSPTRPIASMRGAPDRHLVRAAYKTSCSTASRPEVDSQTSAAGAASLRRTLPGHRAIGTRT
jgi:hypothetical protein